MNIITAEVLEQKHLVDDIYSMWIKSEGIADQAHSGQFVSLYCNDPSKLLPRPISICEVDKERQAIRLVYRAIGAGTKQFSQFTSGDKVRIIGPVGNGYDLNSDNPVLMGGGIGIPPMLELAKEFSLKGLTKDKIRVILGFRDNTFLIDDFEKYATVYISSDTGSFGVHGNVLDAAKEYGIEADMIYACGPTPMLRAIQQYSFDKGIEAQLSLEERMACSVGACLACVCKTKDIDDHSKVKNKRVCVDGPVMRASEVEL